MSIRATNIILVSLTLLLIVLSASSLIVPYEYSLRIWIYITRLASTTVYISIFFLIYFLDDSDKGYKAIFTLTISSWINLLIKDITAIPRPTNPLIKVSGYSFPSGHAQSSTTFWSSLTYLYNNNILLVFSITIIFLISISRIILNVHYPIDILGGVSIGFAVTTLFIVVVLEEISSKYNYLRRYLHIILGTLIISTYYFYHETSFIEYGGFIIGLTIHNILYRDFKENILKGGIKLILILFISYILSIFTGSILEIFLSSLSLGIFIALIRFRI